MTDRPQLRDVANELLARLDTEVSRPPGTPATHLVGGLLKVGSKLETLLRVALEAACAERGRQAAEFLPVIQGRRRSLRVATAGELARALEKAADAHVGEARILVEDLRKRDSIIYRVVHIRNDAAHKGHVASNAADALQALRRLVEQVAS